MKTIEEISERFHKKPAQVESDMMEILLQISEKGVIPKIGKKRYLKAISDYLLSNGYYELSYGKFALTEEGWESLQEGYVEIEPQTHTDMQDTYNAMSLFAKFLSILTTCWGFLKSIFEK